MLNACRFPLTIGGNPREIWVHSADALDQIEERAARMGATLEVKDGFPEQVLELNDVYVVPGESTSCLYDSEGFRIPESCVRRGDQLEDYVGFFAKLRGVLAVIQRVSRASLFTGQ